MKLKTLHKVIRIIEKDEGLEPIPFWAIRTKAEAEHYFYEFLAC